MCKENFSLMPVKDLSGKKFFIPSYQRGYRWGEQQVTDLLNDIKEAENKDYCIQPLVVTFDKKTTSYNVIDGQQRLTTIFLILKALGKEQIFTLTFETRRKSSAFLDDINKTYKDSKESMSPDEYYISKAYEHILNWLNEAPDNFDEKILNHTQFIWYETQDNAYDTFCRLNTGKISLSNAELIKALLFKNEDLKEGGAPGEWDRIEQKLQENDFWYFICPDPEDERFEATHIDFLFEMLLREAKREFSEKKEQVFKAFIADLKNITETLNKNPYFIFSRLLKAKTPPAEIWFKILSIFRRLNYWYENRRLYHDIGFLMNLKSENKEGRFDILVDLLLKSESQSKENFNSEVKKIIKDIILNGGRKFEYLVYNENNSKLNDVLLLFNIAIMNSHECEISRYPFAQHKKGAWSLEHIHAKKERDINEKDIREIAKIVGINKKDIEEWKTEQLVKGINERTNCDRPQWELIKNNEGKWIIDDDDENTHGLSNLALLARAPNSSLNDKVYMEKREMISRWERDETTSDKNSYNPAYIPIGTRMVFFKHFSGNDSVPFMWTAEDGQEYFSHIVKTIAKYIACETKDLTTEE